MTERLVDVLNARDTVLSIVPVALDDQDDNSNEAACLQKALETAADLHLVPDAEVEGMHARMHVCRGGQLAPVADVLKIRSFVNDRGAASAA